MPALKHIDLRPLRPGDADAFHAMALASWLDAYAGLVPPDMVTDAPRMISRAMASRFDRFVAAFDGDHPVGYYSLGDHEDDRHFLWHLYVDPAAQRRGIGSKLHDAALDALRARGCRVATLDYVAGNAKAAQFYSKQGWIETGREARDGLDLVLMKRDL